MNTPFLHALATWLMLAATAALPAQDSPPAPPRLAQHAIADCGCSAYLPAPPKEVSMTYSEDSSRVYVTEHPVGQHMFSVVAVRFAARMEAEAADYEALLMAYLDYLKTQFEIVSSAGYGTGHRHGTQADAVGVLDFWQDADGQAISVKAWANATHLGVMLVHGTGDYPHPTVQRLFQDGFRFSEK